MNRRDLVLRVLLALIGHPLTLFPFLGGVTVLALAAVGLGIPLTIFFGLLGVLAGIGSFFTLLAFKREGITQKIIEEMERGAAAQRESWLNEVEGKLTADRDRRDDKLFKDLRSLDRGFRESRKLAETVGIQTAFGLYAQVEQLFQLSIKALLKALDILRTAEQMETATVRESMLERRKKILDDVQSTVEKLGAILIGIQHLGEEQSDDTQLARMREELDTALVIARRSDERRREFLKDVNIRDTE